MGIPFHVCCQLNCPGECAGLPFRVTDRAGANVATTIDASLDLGGGLNMSHRRYGHSLR
jgi:hypothetical protein